MDLPAVRRAFGTYRGAPLGTRAFVAARYVVAPLGPLADELRARIQAAIEGMGVVIAAPMLVADAVRQGQLAPLADQALETEDYYWLLMPPGRVRPEAVMFSGWLLHEMSRA